MIFLIFNLESPKEFKVEGNIMPQRATLIGDIIKITLSERCIEFLFSLEIESPNSSVPILLKEITHTKNYTNQANITIHI